MALDANFFMADAFSLFALLMTHAQEFFEEPASDNVSLRVFGIDDSPLFTRFRRIENTLLRGTISPTTTDRHQLLLTVTNYTHTHTHTHAHARASQPFNNGLHIFLHMVLHGQI
jgi:hypothetical protein